jgi:drug/metabolite transporter (DMT)-like permease
MLHSERFARIHVAGLVLGMAGVLMFLSDKLALVRTQGVGDLLLLFATRLFSAHTVAATRLFSRHGITLVMACITLMATGPMLLINAPLAGWPRGPASQRPSGGLTLVAGGRFVRGLVAWGWLNDHMGVPRTAPLLYLLPPVAGFISWMALDESFSSLK